jgi:hypothetical protein
LSGVANSAIYDENWFIGSKNTDATFNGKIYGNMLTKVGTGTFTLTDTCFYTNSTSVNGGKLVLGPKACLKGSLIVGSAGTISGNGAIQGLGTVLGTIAPGINAIGKLIFSSNISFGAASFTMVEAKKLPNANDIISSTGTITFNGTLNIDNIGTAAFAPGDSIQIFKAAKYAGAFKTIVPETPGEGLAWDVSDLTTRGVLKVTTIQSVKELSNLGISIAPNPVKDFLRINFERENANTIVGIYSVSGVLLYNTKTESNQIIVPMTKFKKGITTSNEVAIGRIIKQ